MTDTEYLLFRKLMQLLSNRQLAPDLPAELQSITVDDLLKANDAIRVVYIKAMAQYTATKIQQQIDNLPTQKTAMEIELGNVNTIATK